MIGTVKLSRESLQLCIYSIGLCIYSGGETGHNEILTVKSDLEGKGQSPTPQTIGILTKWFYTFGPNLVILALERVMSYGADKPTMG